MTETPRKDTPLRKTHPPEGADPADLTKLQRGDCPLDLQKTPDLDQDSAIV